MQWSTCLRVGTAGADQGMCDRFMPAVASERTRHAVASDRKWHAVASDRKWHAVASDRKWHAVTSDRKWHAVASDGMRPAVAIDPLRSGRGKLLQRPPWPGLESQGLAGTVHEPAATRVRDHRSVVRAQLETRIADRRALAGRHLGQGGTQPAIRADAAGYHEGSQARRAKGAPALDDQRIHHGFLECARHVSQELTIALSSRQAC